MPLPLSTLTMEAVAAIVDRWRRSETTAADALRKIGAHTIAYQKAEWEESHPDPNKEK